MPRPQSPIFPVNKTYSNRFPSLNENNTKPQDSQYNSHKPIPQNAVQNPNSTNFVSTVGQSRSYTANPATVTDLNWYTDSWATDHVTFNLNQLDINSDYAGKQQLQGGNGECLLITHKFYSSYL